MGQYPLWRRPFKTYEFVAYLAGAMFTSAVVTWGPERIGQALFVGLIIIGLTVAGYRARLDTRPSDQLHSGDDRAVDVED
jgi:hypothetical protein